MARAWEGPCPSGLHDTPAPSAVALGVWELGAPTGRAAKGGGDRGVDSQHGAHRGREVEGSRGKLQRTACCRH